MNRSRGAGSVAILRRALLGLLLVFAVGIVGLYFLGRYEPSESALARLEDEADSDGTSVLSGEGWDYEVSQGGSPLFRIQGERMISDRDNNVTLEGVGLTFFRGDRRYVVKSDSGSYNTETKEAALTGNVEVEGPDGLRLLASQLSIPRGGQVLRSRSPVVFEMVGLYRGRSDSLTVNLPRDLYVLEGDVAIDSIETAVIPMTLRSDRLLLERGRGLLRASGGADITYGDAALSALRVTVYLTEDEKTARSILARREVEVRWLKPQGDGLTRELTMKADSLTVLMSEETGEAESFELESNRRTARVRIADETGLARGLESPYIRGELVNGELSRVQTSSPAQLSEFFLFSEADPVWWTCSRRATAEFVDGEVTILTLAGPAQLWANDFFAEGSEVVFLPEEETVLLTGDPARVLTLRGDLEAPEIERRPQEIHARGGVRGNLAGERSSVPRDDSGAVTRVEAQEAIWHNDPEAVTLTGGVQVWRGESLLIAEEVREMVASQQLTAQGGVRTVWKPPPRQEGTAADGEGEGETGAEGEGEPTKEDAPIEAMGASLELDRLAQRAVYRGDVSVRQSGRRIFCQELELELGDEDDVERMTCTDQVRMTDPLNGQRIEGDVAVYDVALGKITVSGKRVTLHDSEGGEIEGPVLVYDVNTGRARIESESVFEQELDLEEEIRDRP